MFFASTLVTHVSPHPLHVYHVILILHYSMIVLLKVVSTPLNAQMVPTQIHQRFHVMHVTVIVLYVILHLQIVKLVLLDFSMML